MADMEQNLSLADALTEPPPQIEEEVKRDFMATLEAEKFDDVIGEKVGKTDYVPLLDDDDDPQAGNQEAKAKPRVENVPRERPAATGPASVVENGDHGLEGASQEPSGKIMEEQMSYKEFLDHNDTWPADESSHAFESPFIMKPMDVAGPFGTDEFSGSPSLGFTHPTATGLELLSFLDPAPNQSQAEVHQVSMEELNPPENDSYSTAYSLPEVEQSMTSTVPPAFEDAAPPTTDLLMGFEPSVDQDLLPQGGPQAGLVEPPVSKELKSEDEDIIVLTTNSCPTLEKPEEGSQFLHTVKEKDGFLGQQPTAINLPTEKAEEAQPSLPFPAREEESPRPVFNAEDLHRPTPTEPGELLPSPAAESMGPDLGEKPHVDSPGPLVEESTLAQVQEIAALPVEPPAEKLPPEQGEEVKASAEVPSSEDIAAPSSKDLPSCPEKKTKPPANAGPKPAAAKSKPGTAGVPPAKRPASATLGPSKKATSPSAAGTVPKRPSTGGTRHSSLTSREVKPKVSKAFHSAWKLQRVACREWFPPPLFLDSGPCMQRTPLASR
ncbi:PREDICTED: microtubule-associated protein 4-like [Thamnophis sirtalis]|uniref:Microtubule-associated protein 4-like n=1 Tax=Thamnophis sirtalis TaxID=35019 RepID=A0A6I9YGV8_9SAUR|nr:PREDICTED: microtubule-associated protein 4-like [Thamnophis sirtalis]